MPLQVTSTNGTALRTAQTQAGANPFDTMTVTQAVAWVNANIADANTKTALIQIIKALFVLRADVQCVKEQVG